MSIYCSEGKIVLKKIRNSGHLIPNSSFFTYTWDTCGEDWPFFFLHLSEAKFIRKAIYIVSLFVFYS